MILTQAEAKQFFVRKALDQAVREHVPLSDAEREMLSWSEMSDEQYESKIAELLKRAYERDLTSDAGARNEYTRAYSVLNRGDPYILVMFKMQLGRRLKPWWLFWR